MLCCLHEKAKKNIFGGGFPECLAEALGEEIQKKI
jgi:hypothetical protein